MADLYTQIDEGQYSIEIKNTRRGRFPVLNKGEERTLTKDEDEELRDMMKKYKDIILELYDINEKYDGTERAWRLGEKMSSVNSSDQADVQALFQILPVERFSDSSAYRYRIFYEAFPEGEGNSNKEYNPAHKHTVLSELVQRSKETETKTKYEVAREVYNRVRDREDLSQDEIRAWAQIDDSDFELQDVVAAVKDSRIQSPDTENVKTVYNLLGQNPPADEEIEAAL